MLNLVFNKPINHDFKTIFLTKSHLIVVFNDDSTKMNKLYKMMECVHISNDRIK